MMLKIKLVIAALALASAGGVLYLGYSKVKDIGYQEAVVKYDKKLKEYENAVVAKVSAIEENSVKLVTENAETNSKLRKDLSNIVKGFKGQPMTIIQNGECIPSPTFSQGFSAVNKRVNESIKDKKP